MSEATMLTVLGTICATLFGLLCGLLAFGGTKLIHKMDQLYDRVDDYVSNLHMRINGIDTRVTVLETKCVTHHNEKSRQ